MAATRTVYRERSGEVEKIATDMRDPVLPPVDYHEGIIRTYHQLECEGKLGNMSAKAKRYVRDIHTYAQTPEYWDS